MHTHTHNMAIVSTTGHTFFIEALHGVLIPFPLNLYKIGDLYINPSIFLSICMRNNATQAKLSSSYVRGKEAIVIKPYKGKCI